MYQGRKTNIYREAQGDHINIIRSEQTGITLAFPSFPDGCGYTHDRRADKYPYPHDRRADKDSYPHDRNVTVDLCSLIKLCFAFIMVNFST